MYTVSYSGNVSIVLTWYLISTKETEGENYSPSRLNGETFVQAFEREQRPQAHLITIPDTVEYYESDKESDDEEAEDFVYAIRGSDFDTFGAERPAKQITTKRKMVMDGVYPPRVK